jgi:hypothetical protein
MPNVPKPSRKSKRVWILVNGERRQNWVLHFEPKLSVAVIELLDKNIGGVWE